jgi:urea carboxylase
MWNRWRQTAEFTEGKPWLLRFFDQIRFYPVSAEELLQIREDFPRGRHRLEIEERIFSLRDYNAFLAAEADSIAAFKRRQQAAFDAERARWIETGQAHYSTDQDVADAGANSELDLPPNSRPVATPVAGNVWQVKARPGDRVQQGDPVIVVESMKMEIAIAAPLDGTVTHLFCEEGGQVLAGQDLFVIHAETPA